MTEKSLRRRLSDDERKAARTAALVKYREAHGDEIRVRAAEWARANREARCDKLRENDRRYYAKNQAVVIARKAKYRSANPDTIKAIGKKSYQKHQEKRAAQARQNRADNPALSCLYAKRWRDNNKDIVRIQGRNNRARRLSAEGRFTKHDVESLNRLQKGKCAYCQIKLAGSFHIDHIMPLIKGGTNWPKNLQLTCAPCNLRKNDTHPLVFARRLGLLV